MYQFTDKELATIAAALDIAEQRYESDAYETRYPRLAEQFKKQAADCRAVAAKIIV